tara:strand:+ start:951 stop:1118 length:168 start_codon:yes stop_codon:yes gene_type:complete
MPKIINLHIDNWQLAVETAQEVEREEQRWSDHDLTDIEELIERHREKGILPELNH